MIGAVFAVAVGLGYGIRDSFSLPVMGEAAGIVAIVFIVASLVLMLRLPSLARVCGGLETMYSLHRGVLSSRYVVGSIAYPTNDVIDIELAPMGRPLPVHPGQFLFTRFDTNGDYAGCGHFHPFTASEVMPDGRVRLSIKASGPCTLEMQRVVPGTPARLQGPFGELFQNVRQDTQVWVAGGIGITPFLARARALDSQHVPVRLFYFVDSIND